MSLTPAYITSARHLHCLFVTRTSKNRGEIALSDVRYEVTTCPLNQYMPNKKNTVCMLFTATAENNLKRNVEAANVFGFVDDQQNNSARGKGEKGKRGKGEGGGGGLVRKAHMPSSPKTVVLYGGFITPSGFRFELMYA